MNLLRRSPLPLLMIALLFCACASVVDARTHLLDGYRAAQATATTDPVAGKRALLTVSDEHLKARLRFGRELDSKELAAAEQEVKDVLAAAKVRDELAALR